MWKGGLAILDPVRRAVAASIPMPGHPESFRIQGGRAYVNVPDAARIVVADMATGREIASWPTPGARWNFPMALDPAGRVLAVVFRLPGRLRLIEPQSGRTLADMAACGDADDVFFDDRRHRLYVICGSGETDVIQADAAGPGYRRIGGAATRAGARTGLFAPEQDRLYVAARASGSQPAAILIYRPAPCFSGKALDRPRARDSLRRFRADAGARPDGSPSKTRSVSLADGQAGARA